MLALSLTPSKALSALLFLSALSIQVQAQDDNNNESDRDNANANSASGTAAVAQASTSTTSASTSQTSSVQTLKLAKRYIGEDFYNGFDYFTADDPTAGYVNYVSKSAAQKEGLVDVQSGNTFLMRADSSNIPTGRGRDSIRITSKDQFADGVYILDLNHMPVGCGTWPAFWTVTKNGWPKGGEIDILEGANGLPSSTSAAYNATTGLSANPNPQVANVVALHTSDTCTITGGTYMNGQVGETQCSAYVSGNTGCGIKMTGNANGTYGAPFNAVGGGWYAMWRDLENSGGVYVYYWPRDSASVPEDVRNPNTATTNVAEWGVPSANLSVPTCKKDFGKHVIVFDLTFCGDYAGATYTATGCPGSCASFVRSNPAAFSEAYWSLNSLRVYTASGKPAAGAGLSGGAIAGIVIGCLAAVVITGLVYWRYKTSKRHRKVSEEAVANEEPIPAQAKGPYAFLAARKPRLGPTTLAPGRTAKHFLDGETPTQVYGRTPAGSGSDIKLAEATYRPHGGNSSWIG
ncbi:hypothetical protein IAT40_006453 [Kwoniella sp. CBS 6097]